MLITTQAQKCHVIFLGKYCSHRVYFYGFHLGKCLTFSWKNLIVYFRAFSKTTYTAPGTFSQLLNEKTIPDLPWGNDLSISIQNLYFVSAIQIFNFIFCTYLFYSEVHVLALCSEFADLFGVITEYVYYQVVFRSIITISL